ncbi:MAG TPA: NUDIX hydrolase [Pyrinomonadaceae bacterium]|jgi:8-oxo-dGTP pyrophosphatase MutT (NUDIX family)|nr:NUDIX hydrolase [Pyrinomonadaceae bacterium]
MPSDLAPAKIFGVPVEGAAYQPRPAAYAVIKTAGGAVAAVRSKSGYYFLPGGGARTDETAAETVRRELREELAREVRLVRELGRAVQYFCADGVYYRMAAVFFATEFAGEPTGAGEHQLHWLQAEELTTAFFHQCHVWAVNGCPQA